VIGFTLLALALLQFSVGRGSRPDSLRSPLSPPDSARIVRAAQSAQRSFESFRRMHLPIGHGYSGDCDARIGRYCYWRGDDDEEKEPA